MPNLYGVSEVARVLNGVRYTCRFPGELHLLGRKGDQVGLLDRQPRGHCRVMWACNMTVIDSRVMRFKILIQFI